VASSQTGEQHERVSRRTAYFLLMGSCLALICVAWLLVRLVSVPVAVGMSVVAMVLPPIAVVIGNSGPPDERF
jgi:Flp pilus assembly protein TadB